MNWYIWPMAVVCIISFLTIKEKYNPITVFSGFWLTITILSEMDLYDVPKPDNYIYVLVMMGVCFFAIGAAIYSFASKRVRFKIGDYVTGETSSSGIRYKQFNFFIVVLLLLLVMYLVRSLGYMLAGIPMNVIRQNFRSWVIRSPIEQLLWTFIVLPATIGLVPISLYAYAIDKKGIKYILVSLFATMFLSLCDGGRVYLMFYVIQFAFFTIFKPADERVSAKIKNRFLKTLFFIAVAVGCIALMAFISNERQVEESFAESLYIYFTGCFPFMEAKMADVSASELYAYGGAFLYAPLTLGMMVLKNLGFIDYPEFFLRIQDTINALQNYTRIDGFNFNAFASIFFYFYYDFREVGICLGSFLFGFIANRFFVQMKKTNSARHMMVYSTILIAIASSMVRWQFGRPEFFMSLVYIYWMTRKDKKREI